MKKIRLCALMLASVILSLSLTATSTVAATEPARGLPGFWEYSGDETTVIVPDTVDIIVAGTFCNSQVQTVIINHDVILCGNAFYGAYNLTDIYFYADNAVHLFDLYSGKPCKHEELVCMDEACMPRYGAPVYTSILSGPYAATEKYVSTTLTIHGHKGSTAEHFVEVVNSNPTLFNCPQTLVFQAIEDESQEPVEDNTEESPQEPEEDAEEGTETPEEEPQEPPASDDKSEEGTDKGDAEESPEEPPEEPKSDVHLKGAPGTSLSIANFNGITYPRYVYMSVGSYYILELGNVPEGCTYKIPEMYCNMYTLDTQTGKITALRSGATVIKIRLIYPDGRYANLSCNIQIKGD